MKFFQGRQLWLAGALCGYVLLALALGTARGAFASQTRGPRQQVGPANFGAPTTSSPITLDAAKNLIWVVNPAADSVSVIGNLDGTPSVLDEITVGDEPRSVALTAGLNAYKVFVANAASNDVTVINVTSSSATGVQATVERTITTGAEPWNIVATPDGGRIFVANSVQDTITVLNASNLATIGNVNLRDSACNVGDKQRHFQPRGLAVTQDGGRLFVTRFLSFTGGPNPKQAADDGKVGVVCQLNIPASIGQVPTVAGATEIAPQNTGFNDAANNPTKAHSNQMQSIVIRGNQAYLPNIAASPAGPLKFNVDTQAFVNVLDVPASGLATDASSGKFLNLHLGAREPEAGKTKLFFANLWGIAFTNQSGAGNAYAVASGSDLLVKLNVDADGKLAFTVDDNTTRYIDLNGEEAANSGANAGKNPLGIVIRNNKAYTMNFVSRNVSVVDLGSDSVVGVVKTGDLPEPGSKEEELLVGAEGFFSSRGVYDRPAGTTVSTRDRLSSEGWQSCSSCHFNGWTDGTVWTFETGPRKSIPMNGTWSPHNKDDQRVLNYSAVRDRTEDFELNARNISGPGALAQPLNGSIFDPNHGLLISDTGNINFAPAVINNFALPNAGRAQHTVTLPGSNKAWPALTAINEWLRFAVRTPNGALTTAELTGGLNANDVSQGRTLFFKAGCQTCHGGTKWSNSSAGPEPPNIAQDVSTEKNPAAPAPPTFNGAQYLFKIIKDIKSFNLNVDGSNQIPGRPQIGGIEQDTNKLAALGKDHDGDGKGNGYNIPSLLGIGHLPPYYHNGACETLACVLDNVDHRRSGLKQGRPDPLNDAESRRKLALWMETLDAETEFPTNLIVRKRDIFTDPNKVFAGSQVQVGANITLFGTTADLVNLTEGGIVKVKFTAPGLDKEVDLPVSAFAEDFGQAVVSTTWDVPNNVGLATITVQVDTAGALDDDDRDDTAQSNRNIQAPPPDRTKPVVSNVRISDEATFDDEDLFTTSTDVKVRFQANDPASGGGAETSGLDSVCVVTYYYSTVERSWIKRDCRFEPLPAPEGDTFTVDAELTDKLGAAYVFVYVRDKAGNISAREFGFTNLLPSPNEDIELNAEQLIFRVRLNAGQSFTLNATPSAGDVDLAAFALPSRQRVAVSAQNGTEPESITVTSNANNSLFQIQIKPFGTEGNIFRLSVSDAAAVGLQQTNNVDPSKQATLPNAPLVSTPPAAQTEVSDISQVFMPLTTR
jgi:YVTN family beta-propeller protein